MTPGQRLAEALGISWEPDDVIGTAALERMAAPPAPQLPDAQSPPRPRGRRLTEIPACWSWEFDPTTPRGNAAEQFLRLSQWQDDRCGVCGCHDAATEDHDHATGLTRGYLCRSCNHGEAVSGLRVFALYRWRHPTSILGLHLPYTGRGWKNGKPVGALDFVDAPAGAR